MQKFRQHNKIFVEACNWGQNAVKYTLTKNGQTCGEGSGHRGASSFVRRHLPPAGGAIPQDGRGQYAALPESVQKGKTGFLKYDLSH